MPGTADCYQRGEPLMPYPSDTREPLFLDYLTTRSGVCDRDCWRDKAMLSVEWRLSEMVLLAREQALRATA
eukprot:1110538-Pleurochrysis_carterae.AAC.3